MINPEPQLKIPHDVIAGQVTRTTRAAFRLDERNSHEQKHRRDPIPPEFLWYTTERGIKVPDKDSIIIGYVRKGSTSVVWWE